MTSVDTVYLDVPDVSTGEFVGFIVNVRNGFRVFRAVGWTVTFVKLPTSRTETNVLPSTIPVATPVAGSAASVVQGAVSLPESAGSTQYWVPVLESHLAAALHAREWTVIFHKAPRPVA
jgi:hypothetical protein